MKTKRLQFLFHLLLAVCIHTAGVTTAMAQTLEVLPVNPFYSGAQAQNFIKRTDGSYFFFATDGTNGLQLWKTDGTPAGTVQLPAPAPYSAGFPEIGLPSPTYTSGKTWLLLNNELYFVIDQKYLFCSKGNTLQLLTTSENTISELTASGNTVYFKNIEEAGSLPSTISLWKTDGTIAGTRRLKTFDGGNINSRASFQVKLITNVNGTVFFIAGSAGDGVGYALYKSDGTTAGTALVKDINTVDTNLTVSDLYAAGRYLYFKANPNGTTTSGAEWWISNGTAAGTYQITHFGNFNSGSVSANTIAHNDTLYIATSYGATNDPRQIWKLTPDPSNPDSIYYEAKVNTVSLLKMMDEKIYFTDTDIFYASRRFYAGGRSRTDTVLLQLGAVPQGSDPATMFYPLNGYYYYFARMGTSVYNLWRTNGTAEGTTLVSDATKSPGLVIQVGNTIYFRAVDAKVSGSTAFNIWKSDGTTEGTKKVADRIFPNQVGAMGTDGTYYYFTSTDSVWATNGDTVINVPLGSASTMAGLRPTGIYPTANKLVVTAKLATGTSNANLDLFAGDFASSTQPQPQTISFTDVTKTYGDADAAVGATTTSGLDITYSIADPAIATITNGTLHILKSGVTTITASQPGNGTSWLPAADVTVTLTVNKAALTVTADDKTKEEGDPNPAFTFTCTGFVNGETATVLTAQPAVTTTATQASPAGTYAITASGAAAENYTITYVDGTLTINPPVQQPQTITFAGVTKTYGAADFAPGATATSGLQVVYTSDNPAVASITGNSIHIVGAGTANITASQPGNSFWLPATNVTVVLIVNKAALTITAENKSRFQDEPNPTLTVAYTGFVNGETSAALTTQPAITTTATLSSAPGFYPVTVSGATANNYVITYAEGTLTIKALPVTEDRVDAVFIGNTLQARVYSSKAQRAVLQLADVTGRVLLTQDVSLTNGLNTYQLPVFNISAGAYIVLVRGEGLKLVDKIIK